MARGSGANLQSKNLLTINKTADEERGKGVHLRVVDWINGDKHYPQLEKREFFKDEQTGEWKMGKAKGLNLADLALIQKNWDAIIAAMNGKSAPVLSKPADTPSQKSESSESPDEEF